MCCRRQCECDAGPHRPPLCSISPGYLSRIVGHLVRAEGILESLLPAFTILSDVMLVLQAFMFNSHACPLLVFGFLKETLLLGDSLALGALGREQSVPQVWHLVRPVFRLITLEFASSLIARRCRAAKVLIDTVISIHGSAQSQLARTYC